MRRGGTEPSVGIAVRLSCNILWADRLSLHIVSARIVGVRCNVNPHASLCLANCGAINVPIFGNRKYIKVTLRRYNLVRFPALNDDSRAVRCVARCTNETPGTFERRNKVRHGFSGGNRFEFKRTMHFQCGAATGIGPVLADSYPSFVGEEDASIIKFVRHYQWRFSKIPSPVCSQIIISDGCTSYSCKSGNRTYYWGGIVDVYGDLAKHQTAKNRYTESRKSQKPNLSRRKWLKSRHNSSPPKHCVRIVLSRQCSQLMKAA